MSKLWAVFYGVVCYLVFFLTFLYAVGFIANFGVPKGIDDGVVGSRVGAFVVDLLLMSLFAVQHSVMARPGFKSWWTRFVPQPVERSTYVLFSSLALIFLYWLWQSLPEIVWQVNDSTLRLAVWAVFWLGWGIVLFSTFLLNHFELFGLRQVYLHFIGATHIPVGFRTPLLYRWVRHPIMLGFIIAFWATPQMSVGHLLFAVVTTLYIMVAVYYFEERDLLNYHGVAYVEYRQRVSMIVPMPRKRR